VAWLIWLVASALEMAGRSVVWFVGASIIWRPFPWFGGRSGVLRYLDIIAMHYYVPSKATKPKAADLEITHDYVV
jgi:hypothetical protein